MTITEIIKVQTSWASWSRVHPDEFTKTGQATSEGGSQAQLKREETNLRNLAFNEKRGSNKCIFEDRTDGRKVKQS
jgi:hypothetical protein